MKLLLKLLLTELCTLMPLGNTAGALLNNQINVDNAGSNTFVQEDLSYEIIDETNNYLSVKNSGYNYEILELTKTISYESKEYTITKVADNAFENLTTVLTVDIGDSVTFIGDKAFQGCNRLFSLFVRNPVPPTLGENALTNTNFQMTIYVPSESLELYQTADGWSSFSDQIDTFKTIKDVISSDPHFPISYNTGYQQYEGDGAAYADDDYFYVGNGIDIEIQQDINKPLIKYHADWGEGPEYEFDSYLYNVPKSSDYTVYFQVQSEVLYQIKMVGIGQFEGNYPRQASHSLSESFPEVSPTCTEKGSHAYYKCSCGLYFEDENLTKRIGGEDKLNEWKIQELGHDFDNGEAVYEWQINDNNLLESKCVGKFYCSHTDHGCTEFESLTADARYVKDSDATNTSNEKGHFEAEFSNGKTARTESNSYEVKDTMLIEEVNNNNDGLSACAVIGIVIGVLVGFCLICYLVAFFIWKKGGDPFSVIYKSFEKLNSLLFERK